MDQEDIERNNAIRARLESNRALHDEENGNPLWKKHRDLPRLPGKPGKQFSPPLSEEQQEVREELVRALTAEPMSDFHAMLHSVQKKPVHVLPSRVRIFIIVNQLYPYTSPRSIEMAELRHLVEREEQNRQHGRRTLFRSIRQSLHNLK